MSNDAAITLPALTDFALAGYDILASGSIEIRVDNDGLGGMSVSGYSGLTGSSSMAAMTVSGTASAGNDVRLTLPACDAVGYAGAGGAVETPAATISAWTTNPGSGGVTLPQMGAEASGTTGLVASGNMTMPVVSVAGNAVNNIIANGLCEIRLEMQAYSLTGRIARGGVMMIAPMSAAGSASVASGCAGEIRFWPLELDALATVDSSLFNQPITYNSEAMQ